MTVASKPSRLVCGHLLPRPGRWGLCWQLPAPAWLSCAVPVPHQLMPGTGREQRWERTQKGTGHVWWRVADTGNGIARVH